MRGKLKVDQDGTESMDIKPLQAGGDAESMSLAERLKLNTGIAATLKKPRKLAATEGGKGQRKGE